MGEKSRLVEQRMYSCVLNQHQVTPYQVHTFTTARFKLRLIHMGSHLAYTGRAYLLQVELNHEQVTYLHDSAFLPAPNYRACIPFVLLYVPLRADLSKLRPQGQASAA